MFGKIYAYKLGLGQIKHRAGLWKYANRALGYKILGYIYTLLVLKFVKGLQSLVVSVLCLFFVPKFKAPGIKRKT